MPTFVQDHLAVQIANLPFWLIQEIRGVENLVFSSGKGADLLFNKFLHLSTAEQELFGKCYNQCKEIVREFSGRPYHMENDVYKRAIDPWVFNRNERDQMRQLIGTLFSLRRAIRKSANKHGKQAPQEQIFFVPVEIEPVPEEQSIMVIDVTQPALFPLDTIKNISRQQHFEGLFFDYQSQKWLSKIRG